MRDRQPAERGRCAKRGCRSGGAAAGGRRADPGHDELSGIPDGLRDGEPAARAYGESVGRGADAGRIERRRVGGHCCGHVGGGARFGQRRVGACAGTLYGDLQPETDAGPRAGARASAAVRGAVFHAGGNWADGADDGRCFAAIWRSGGQDPHRPGQPAGSSARVTRHGACAAFRIGVFEDDGLFAGDGGDTGGGAGRGAGARGMLDSWSRRSGRARWNNCANCGGRSLCNAAQCFTSRRSAASGSG